MEALSTHFERTHDALRVLIYDWDPAGKDLPETLRSLNVVVDAALDDLHQATLSVWMAHTGQQVAAGEVTRRPVVPAALRPTPPCESHVGRQDRAASLKDTTTGKAADVISTTRGAADNAKTMALQARSEVQGQVQQVKGMTQAAAQGAQQAGSTVTGQATAGADRSVSAGLTAQGSTQR